MYTSRARLYCCF